MGEHGWRVASRCALCGAPAEGVAVGLGVGTAVAVGVLVELGATVGVAGPGVVGHQPVLEPGQSFEYTSFCPLTTPVGSMHGSYRMVRPGGASFDARIAPFSLAVPNSLN